jgi:hypothetical protein
MYNEKNKTKKKITKQNQTKKTPVNCILSTKVQLDMALLLIKGIYAC